MIKMPVPNKDVIICSDDETRVISIPELQNALYGDKLDFANKNTAIKTVSIESIFDNLEITRQSFEIAMNPPKPKNFFDIRQSPIVRKYNMGHFSSETLAPVDMKIEDIKYFYDFLDEALRMKIHNN